MKPRIDCVYGLIVVAICSTALLTFSFQHLLNYHSRMAEYAEDLIQQDLGMPRPKEVAELNRARGGKGDVELNDLNAYEFQENEMQHVDETKESHHDRADGIEPPVDVNVPPSGTRATSAAQGGISYHTKVMVTPKLAPPVTALTPRPATTDAGKAAPRKKIVLLWTPWFGLDMWWFKPGNASFVENRCPAQNCYATSNRSLVSLADLVLFQASKVVFRNVKKQLSYDIPQDYARPPAQLWGFATRESPLNTYSGDELKPLDGLMNLTMTYKRDSDVVFPFSHLHVKRNTSLSPQQYGAKRKKLALWFVSNCRPRSKRMMLYNELQRHIGGRIDMFGKCSNRTNPCGPGMVGDCERDVVPQYKFYLAFENSMCRDYVTEKFFLKLYKGAVPIVYGASLDDYAALAPPNSYLHVDNFTSVAALAKHMLHLDADDTAYDSYHRWREHYDVLTSFGTGSVWADFVCRSCQLATEGAPGPRRGMPHSDLSTWFSPKDCKVVVEKP